LRRITSIDLGIAPGGIFVGSSWTRSFWKSLKSERLTSSYQFFISQFLPKHFLGYVYLNCWGTDLLYVPHILHLKIPETSSGLTSVVLVTVPLKQNNFPSLSHRRSLTLTCSKWLIELSKVI
jgi:hypothetical protein